MEIAEYIDILRRDGAILADAAEEAGLEAEVPRCSGWRVRDLVRHTGLVHRWAAGYVIEGRTTASPIEGDTPDDDKLLDWFREGHARLVEGLATAPEDVRCWHFLPAPSPLAFWARRQAHETAIHRVDAEAALGKGPSVIAAGFAADGVDELVAGFHARERSRVRSDVSRTLRMQAVDVPAGQGDWLVRISREPVRVERTAAADADCTLRGTAAGLYVALWNRTPETDPDVSGDASLLALWRETSPIT